MREAKDGKENRLRMQFTSPLTGSNTRYQVEKLTMYFY